jgi:hypothetical protein
MGLREDNIAKNEEFKRLALPLLIVSICITVVAPFIIIGLVPHSIANGVVDVSIENDAKNVVAVSGLVSVIITIWLCYSTFSRKCPECEARWYAKQLSKDLVSENNIGTKVENDKTIAVVSRVYNCHNICKYCGYKWDSTKTEKREVPI